MNPAGLELLRMPMVIGRGSDGPEANVASGGKPAAGASFSILLLLPRVKWFRLARLFDVRDLE